MSKDFEYPTGSQRTKISEPAILLRDMIVEFFWTDHFWFAQKRLIVNNSSKQNHPILTGKNRLYDHRPNTSDNNIIVKT